MHGLNCIVLDQLVMQHLQLEGQMDNRGSKREEEEQQVEFRGKQHQINMIRDLLLHGNVGEALSALQAYHPQVVADPKVVFRLHKQHCIELLRVGNVEAALHHCRFTFGPFALDAFPEAYDDFKRTLLLLLYPMASHQPTSLSAEWEPRRLHELAASIISSIQAQIGVHHSQLSTLLRYLIAAHNVFHVMQGISSLHPEIEQMMLHEREPPPLPKEGGYAFEEADVQALAQAVSISREEAINSLKYTNGHLVQALKNELARMRMDNALLEAQLREYCRFRGLPCNNWKYGGKRNEMESTTEMDECVEQLRKVRKLTVDGSIADVVSATQPLHSNFLRGSPHVYFQLKQCEFVNLVHSKQYDEALNIARNSLAPVTIDHPDLVAELKQTALMLACSKNGESSPSILAKMNPRSITGPLFSVMGKNLGLKEPKLCDIMKYLLQIHTEWFKQQMCEDIFGDFFQLPLLKQGDSELDLGEESNIQLFHSADSPGMEELPFEQQSILQLMEFMALSRAEAINLLHQFEGNLEEIFATLIS